MAAGSLLALLDDIASVLDDVSLMTKVAAKKTAGVLGDDLALNAEQVSGVRVERELPVVWAVAKGSFINKLILVPVALVISAFAPWLITPLLMLGGIYLCYEGIEKVLEWFLHRKSAGKTHIEQLDYSSSQQTTDFEQMKIRGAIRTDFILSAEIIVIALGTVKDAALIVQIGVVSVIAITMTVGVYGLVAGIVKLDDFGLFLLKDTASSLWGELKRKVGRSILWLMPFLMHALSFVGTLAMFLVGGGIMVHGIHRLHDWLEHITATVQVTSGNLFSILVSIVITGVAGLIVGGIALAGVKAFLFFQSVYAQKFKT